ncbi:uncharacterized protein LOC109720554 [Ananas comosus]|uniref:Uncharacterized protein LOC109720554 n=1 Tax=Ananas comosus TaxID=4615 RepID=A0A6P5G434_ANACO|nr:uncharacterized protein LOC109720554 [Ananas comosus]
MAFLKYWCFIIALFCMCPSWCKSDGDAVDIVTKALACFDERSVYSSCQESYRLNAEGSINVPPVAIDEYCNGPCLIETKLVLECVDNILYNFKFYNGASIHDARFALYRGCGHTDKRGDFNVLDHLGEEDYYDDYFGNGNKLANPIHLLIFLSCALLLWGY